MTDALKHARRLRQCALKALKLAQDSPSPEAARHYRLIFQHYTALARLAESDKEVEQEHSQAQEHNYARDALKAAS
jgi:hypothetical protein